MPLPEISNPTISELHDLVNTNIANNVVGGIDPTDDRAVRNSIVNYLNNMSASALPYKWKGMFFGIDVGSATDTSTKKYKNRNGGTTGLTIVHSTPTNSTLYKITGLGFSGDKHSYFVRATMFSGNSGAIVVDNDVVMLVVKISADECWIQFEAPTSAVQQIGVDFEIIEY